MKHEGQHNKVAQEVRKYIMLSFKESSLLLLLSFVALALVLL